MKYFIGIVWICIGLLVNGAQTWATSKWGDEVGALIMILGIVAIGYGIASLFWLAQAYIFAVAGPAMLISGIAGMLIFIVFQLFIGIILCGFIGVIGAVLCLRKHGG